MDKVTHIAGTKPAAGHGIVTEILPASSMEMEMTWKEAFADNSYRWKFIMGWVITLINLFLFPAFFVTIQHRPGTQLNDYILNKIPSVDVSVLIFSLIYFSVILSIRRSLKSPALFLDFLWGYVLLNLVRMLTIYLVPLEAPAGLVTLADPVLVPFYGENKITKDLFFSGHTATLFLCFLVVQKKWEKVLVLLATTLVGVLLLVQHIHYTIDVVLAPLFVYVIFWVTKRITRGTEK